MTNSAPKRNFFARLFLSSSEPRLRAGWRLLLQTLMMILIATLAGWLSYVFASGIPALDNSMVFSQLIELLVIGGSIWVARRFFDRRSFVSLGLRVSRHTLPDLLVGILIPAVLMGLIFFAEKAFGWLTIKEFAWESLSASTLALELLIAFSIFIFVGWNEELLSRGYHLQTLASGTSLPWGVILSSSVFGLLHLGNPNATWIGAAGIFFAGLFLALGLLRTRQLWLSIGLHIGWNFFEGPIFGFPVSGISTFHLARITVSGPALWTGGDFGPEAGLIVLPALLLGAVLIYLYTRGRDPLTAIE